MLSSCSRGLLAVALLLGTACSLPQHAEPQAAGAADLKVMSFNIRYGTADDGAFSWPARRQLVAGVIRRENPDVLAIQEGLAFQLEELAPALASYRKYGQHRNGGLAGEFSGLYVREDSGLEVVDSGELWLSPTPQQVGSRGWDAALPRMAVWVELQLAQGKRIRIYGTHFDHRGELARLNSAELLLANAHGGPPSVFLGDFNAEPESPPMQAMQAAGYRSAMQVCDPDNTLGTFNGFQDAQPTRRIDYVLCSPGIAPLRARILDEQIQGIWPSDHFPVVATLRLDPAR